MKKVQIAAGLLEIEATLMNCRAQALQEQEQRFIELLIEARSKLGALTLHLLTDGDSLREAFSSEPRTELALAADAVDPVTASSVEPSTRA